MSQAPTVDGSWPCYFTSLEDYTQILMLHAARIRRCRRNQPSPPCKQISGGVLVIPDSSLLTEASVTITRLAVTTDPAVPCLSHPSRQVWWCTQPVAATHSATTRGLPGTRRGRSIRVRRRRRAGRDAAWKIPHGRFRMEDQSLDGATSVGRWPHARHGMRPTTPLRAAGVVRSCVRRR
jgi:hypothetical protein